MTGILEIPFPEIMTVEIGFDNEAPVFSGRAEIARTPIQHFQNLSYRHQGVDQANQVLSMLLVNNSFVATPMLLLCSNREFEIGYFSFNTERMLTGLGILPATTGIGQCIRSFTDSFVFLAPLKTVISFQKQYPVPVDWDGIRLRYGKLIETSL